MYLGLFHNRSVSDRPTSPSIVTVDRDDSNNHFDGKILPIRNPQNRYFEARYFSSSC
jgi:hypothetical protein